ncbi:FUSC family protein [Streptomyces cylindrosporus]|uniref:FUSC family protein n=1 Tax=Streptomyces cylindrosporus TaxID=2927583 RepID=A0ABS9YDA3_9ACTN|nr:FUSC family protein [Streptomyces cylindrosporus]MCI3275218.1 FUSC family protein [Streptomyces cylindrosporus]
MTLDRTPAPTAPRPRRLPLTTPLHLGRPSDIWFKPALSVVASVAPPNLTLLALGRLDLAMYTMAGSLCALYAHNRPYAARARVLAWVILGMVGGLAVALLTASLATGAVVLVTVGALLAAAQKALCDATRVGPPGNVVLTFISSASLFAPQTLAQVPGHLALALAAGAWAWLVGMAPGLLRPHGPERRATAQALNASAAYAEAHGADDHPHPRHRAPAAAAVQAAWQTLLAARDPRTRRALEGLLVRAEVALAAPADTDPGRLRAWARELTGTGPIPQVHDPAAADELLGVEAELAAPVRPLWRRLGPLAPIAARTALGCALAGYVSLALGVGRPYWALVTAASLYQANLALTWSRGVQRVVGNLLGVLLFAAVVPLAHVSQVLLVLLCVAFNFGAEALMGRNYWLGSVCVTPMALLITEFARTQEPGQLITERVLDTLVGALVGFLAAVAVTNRRSGDRVDHALTAVERARERAARLLAGPAPAPAALESARRSLTAALADLRATVDAASGEWWQRALPQERVVRAEQAGHRTLAATVRHQGLHADGKAEGVRR